MVGGKRCSGEEAVWWELVMGKREAEFIREINDKLRRENFLRGSIECI